MLDVKPEHTITYRAAATAAPALATAAKVGSRDGKTVERLVRMIAFCRASHVLEKEGHETLLKSHAVTERVGEEDEIVVMDVDTSEGRGQKAVIRNELSFQKAIERFSNQISGVAGRAPKPFAFADLGPGGKFKGDGLDAATIEAMGPFVDMGESTEQE